MKNKLLTYIVAGIITATVAVSGIYVYKNKGQAVNPLQKISKDIKETSKKTAADRFKDLFNKKGIKCTDQEGTMLIDMKNHKLLLTVYTTLDDKKQTTHLLYKDNVMYMWTEGQKDGFKMSVDTYEKDKNNEDDFGDFWEIFDSPEKFEAYMKETNATATCKEWRVDSAQFNVPSDVNFTDLDEMKAKIQEQQSQLQEQMKKQCDSLSGEEKTNCLNSIDSGIAY